MPPGPATTCTARVLTQTLTRPQTTITALVTLGGQPAAAAATTAAASARVPSPSAGLSSGAVGAIVGCVLGFGLVLCVLVCCCSCSCQRRPEGPAPYEAWAEHDSGAYEAAAQECVARLPSGPRTVPPPPRFPPTVKYPYYEIRHTSYPQMAGVQRYP